MIFFPDINHYDFNNPIFSYNPKRVIDKLRSSCEIIANYFNLELEFLEGIVSESDIKRNYNHSLLLFSFKSNKYIISFTFPVLEQMSNRSFFIKGYESNIIKTLDVTLWDYRNHYLKIHLLDKSLDPYIEANFKFGTKYKSGNIFEFLQILLYKYPDLYEKHKGELDFLGIKLNERIAIQCLKAKSIERAFLIYSLLYQLNDLVKLYSEDPLDLFLSSIFLLCAGNDISYSEEPGFNLIHKRVKNEETILINLALKDIIEKLIIYSKKFEKKEGFHKIKVDLEPATYAYDYTLLLEQFVSPIALISNNNRVTILGDQGYIKCKAEEVKDFLRDVHSSQFKNLDPINTTDKDKTGVNLWLSSRVKLDEHGRFIDLLDEEEKIIHSLMERGLDKFRKIIEKGEIKDK